MATQRTAPALCRRWEIKGRWPRGILLGGRFDNLGGRPVLSTELPGGVPKKGGWLGRLGSGGHKRDSLGGPGDHSPNMASCGQGGAANGKGAVDCRLVGTVSEVWMVGGVLA